MEGQRWGEVSETGKELVRSLLRVDPGERLAAVEILEHPWFQVGQAARLSAFRLKIYSFCLFVCLFC